MIINKKLLNSKETAEYLGVAEGTLAVWRTNKRYNIPYIKVGHLIKYRFSDIEQWLDERTKGVQNDQNI